MVRYCSIIMVLVAILVCPRQVFGQKDSLVTADLYDANIEQLVSILETQTNLHFYYDSAQFDSATFTIQAKKQPYWKVLDEVFKQTTFQFSVVAPGRVFLTKEP